MKFDGAIVISGGFDPIHIGHLRMIKDASKLGTKLIVIANCDRFLVDKKGYVFMPIEERLEILESFDGVDRAVESIDDDMTVCKTIEWLAKDEDIACFANGGDRRNEDDIPESFVCEKYGIEMEFNVGGGKIQSSSSLVGGEVKKPWGSYKTFEKGNGYLLKRMTINQGEILSLQSHENRSEFWYVSEGVATVECDDNTFDLKKHESTNIPQKSKHRLSNNSNGILKVIEVQIGDLLSEDDITRYEDRYARD
ncbi:MAG: hypothetical protein CMQ73_02275 [Gammaproteobacteria bacterium]|nr:hypothetical protein [Gammaproteobacteria bacterium]OUT96137.1 MAG: hypothetical protein CBB96_02535 [Gammaproteobacteria bacterium TMED36]